MEADPKYEFEAPKWLDFTTNFNDELNDDSSLDDSWFERDHPLHEPKDPSFHDATTKPLLSTTQEYKAAPSNPKPQTSKAKKNYNSKKSLGIKSIRTRRGQHEKANKRQSSGKGLIKNEQSQKADQQICVKDGKKDLERSSVEDGRETPDEIKHDKLLNFTPTWTNSPEASNKTDSTSDANKKQGLSSSLSDTSAFSPRRVPAPQSPMSPARVRSLRSFSGSSLSPKSSLLSKAASGTCQQVSQCKRKKRLLPALPDAKLTPAGAFQGISLSPSRLPCHLNSETNASKGNDQMQEDPEETVLGVSVKPLRASECQSAELATQDRSETFKREEKPMFTQRPLEAIPENSNSTGKALSKDSERQKKFRSSEVETSLNDTRLEALLKQHNKKINAAKSQYDENGRRIRTAEPNICPAPSQKPSSSSTACKRSTTSLEKPAIASKQKRRSCVAAVGNIQSEVAKSKTHSKSSHSSRMGKDTVKQTTKQKRRSCAAAIQHSAQVNDTEKELRDLIAQHNSRVSAKKF